MGSSEEECRESFQGGFMNNKFLKRGVLGFGAACLLSLAAFAQSYSREANGVPGVYSMENVTDWALVEPVDTTTPLWMRDTSASLPLSCTVHTSPVSASDAEKQTALNIFTSLSGDAYVDFLQAGFRQAGQNITVSNGENPYRISVDGIPGFAAVYTLTDSATQIPVRTITYSIFTDGAVVTVGCGSLINIFEQNRALFDQFVDGITFQSTSNTLAAVRNITERNDLSGVTGFDRPQIVSTHTTVGLPLSVSRPIMTQAVENARSTMWALEQ